MLKADKQTVLNSSIEMIRLYYEKEHKKDIKSSRNLPAYHSGCADCISDLSLCKLSPHSG